MSDVLKAWTKEELALELSNVVIAMEKHDELVEAIKAKSEGRLDDTPCESGANVMKKTPYGSILYPGFM